MQFENVIDGILQQRKLPCARNLFSATSYGNHSTNTNTNCDRFIPRRANNNWETNFATIPDAKSTPTGKKARESGEGTRDSSVYSCLLRNELLVDNIEDIKSQCDERQVLTPIKNNNLFKYGTPTKVIILQLINALFLRECLWYCYLTTV